MISSLEITGKGCLPPRRGHGGRHPGVPSAGELHERETECQYCHSKAVRRQHGRHREHGKEAAPELQKNLPPDIQIVAVMDSSEYIRVSINSLLETILLALIIVGWWYFSSWGGGVRPLLSWWPSYLAHRSFIYLYLTGNTINIISLSALSITIGLVGFRTCCLQCANRPSANILIHVAHIV